MDLDVSNNITVSSIFVLGKVSLKRLNLTEINKIKEVKSYKFLYLLNQKELMNKSIQ